MSGSRVTSTFPSDTVYSAGTASAGDAAIIRTYGTALVWPREGGQSLAGAIVDVTNYGAAFYVASGAFLLSALLFTALTWPSRRGIRSPHSSLR